MRSPSPRRLLGALAAVTLILAAPVAEATYVNFESSHVHPLALTPDGEMLLAVNTPDALLERFAVEADGSLTPLDPVPVGLEPVTVVARTNGEAWVVNTLSDTVSIVDLAAGAVVGTLRVGDEPSDVAFAAGRAFVAVSQEDAVKVYSLADLAAPPTVLELPTRRVRALAVRDDGTTVRVYAVGLRSGNETTVLNVDSTFPGAGGIGFDQARLDAMGLRNMDCQGSTPSYPPLPPGITRNPALTDPPDGVPRVGLIVRYDTAQSKWVDERGGDWSGCLPYRPGDHDLFAIDASSLAVSWVDHLGTSLFEVSTHPSGKLWVPHTEARNHVRFEHGLGVAGHMVDNRIAVIDPAMSNAVTQIDLNTHIDRESDPATNLAERLASISQPGMLVWAADGSVGYLTAIGSRKVFRVDGSCLAGSCIFGANRAAPQAVEVGEGPTGVALHEGHERLYVLNRIAHSLAVVDTTSLGVVETLPLHDPTSATTREGRRFLYDGIDGSGHGDASCASCHVSGDLDGLAWDLGDPTGELQPYSTANDNVRFVFPLGGQPQQCNDPPGFCAAHSGFDPQKGPMTTQTLRGMLEPLHWRGDRPTMNDFNKAFVGLMGTADIGPINGAPAGLTAEEMEAFRQFALALRFQPNPYRQVDDTTPCGLRADDPSCEVQVRGMLLPGNPTEGRRIFDNDPSDANQPCRSCHTHPFGAGGGTLGGVTPIQPTSPMAAALFNGDLDGSPHSDLKIPHLRNMYEKDGPVWPAPGAGMPSVTVNGFGVIHDGSIPDLYRFLSASVFNLSAANQAQEVRDLVAFMFHFATGVKPAVGRQVTLPPGTPPTGSAGDESLLTTLIALGDLASGTRHCELVASAFAGGRVHRWHLDGGTWRPDAAGDPPLSTLGLRQGAAGPITFTCATLGAGPRLGGNRDLDVALDGDDCAGGDPETWAEAVTVGGFTLTPDPSDRVALAWSDQSGVTGPGIRYDVLGGVVGDLGLDGLDATGCLAGGLETASWLDESGPGSPGTGTFYLIRARNSCGVASLGPGREPLEALACP